MIQNHRDFIKFFLQQESGRGALLFAAALLALVCANSFLSEYYEFFLSTPVEIRIGALQIAKPLLLWVNDGLMAVFFFLVGLELKRELVEGELSSIENIVLPGVGAIGGMVVPALIYLYFNIDDPVASQGWAIPAATDIAFALGVLMLLGSRVPVSLKVFLTSLAIFDDIGAVVIIALFYTAKISLLALVVIVCCVIALYLINRKNVVSYSPYMFVGIVMWVATLKSGVHATLAGVVLAMFIPIKVETNKTLSPLKSLEDDLQGVVAFLVLPLFAFVNAGISFAGVSVAQLLHGVPLGIALGLFLGKQLGIFGCCWLFIRLKLAAMPDGMNWLRLYGVAVLCGVGFTMSLFIGSLAFEESGVDLFFDERLGIMLGSLLSGIAGYLILRFSLNKGDEKQ